MHADKDVHFLVAIRNMSFDSIALIFIASCKHTYTFTRELPGVALVNISTGQIFMGKGNILNYIDILK